MRWLFKRCVIHLLALLLHQCDSVHTLGLAADLTLDGGLQFASRDFTLLVGGFVLHHTLGSFNEALEGRVFRCVLGIRSWLSCVIFLVSGFALRLGSLIRVDTGAFSNDTPIFLVSRLA